MTERVLEVCKTKPWADVQLVHYASAIKHMGVAPHMGVKLRRYTEGRNEFWQIVLVDRRETESD